MNDGINSLEDLIDSAIYRGNSEYLEKASKIFVSSFGVKLKEIYNSSIDKINRINEMREYSILNQYTEEKCIEIKEYIENDKYFEIEGEIDVPNEVKKYMKGGEYYQEIRIREKFDFIKSSEMLMDIINKY